MAVVPQKASKPPTDEGKAVPLRDEALKKALDSAKFDDDKKRGFVSHGEKLTITIPRYALFKHKSYDKDVRTVVDLEPLVKQPDYAAKIISDQAKIKASSTIAYFAKTLGTESDFLVIVDKEILEPGREEGGMRWSPEAYSKLLESVVAGRALTPEQTAYLEDEDNVRKWEQHVARIQAVTKARKKASVS